MRPAPSRAAVAAVACLALLLTGVAMMAPAGATLRHEAAAGAKQGWNKIWKKKIRPRTDRRYYTRSRADDRFTTKEQSVTRAEADARYAGKGDSYLRSESDGRFAGRGDAYPKAESDARYQPRTKVVRGAFVAMTDAAAAADPAVADISFGVTLAEAPTPHYISAGAALPTGCSGTPAAPDAAVGHLCVFESTRLNLGSINVYSVDTVAGRASTMGAWLLARSTAAGQVHAAGSWVVRFDVTAAG